MWLKILIISAAIAAIYLFIISKFRGKPHSGDGADEVLAKCDGCGTYCASLKAKNGKKYCEECLG